MGRQTTTSHGGRYRAENGNLCKLGGPNTMVPCLHQGNIYIQRKLRVWREQKCIPLVGAETPLTCLGRQSTPFHGGRYRADNGNLRKLGWSYRHGTVFVPRQYIYPKEATGMERTEMYSTSRCKNLTYRCGASKLPRLIGGGMGLRTKTCVRMGGPIAMVPCLHQGNINIQRRLRVWREQK